MNPPSPKKLIEVALQLPETNDGSAYDNTPGLGPHPKAIHHWWGIIRRLIYNRLREHPQVYAEARRAGGTQDS